MASVELRNLVKHYDGNPEPTVRGVNISIKDREFVVLVGPSGCGKSTTLRMIAGLEDITSGELLIGERKVNDVLPKDRNIAMVFQNYALFPNLTVRDNLTFGLKVRGVSPSERSDVAQRVANTLDMTDVLERKPGELSGGQRQRVAVGRAIVREPEVFLFDEPLSNLDANLRGQMRTELIKLHQRLGATMIYVTHDQIEAMTMADRIVVFNEGHIQQVGTPQEVYQRPCNRFVAGFLGNPPMNFFDGTVQGEGDELTFVSRADGGLRLALGEEAHRLPACAQEGVTLGIRPEDIGFCDASAQGINTVVDVTEYFGAESSVTARIGDDKVVSLTKGTPPKPGDVMHVTLNRSRLHFFSGPTLGVCARSG